VLFVSFDVTFDVLFVSFEVQPSCGTHPLLMDFFVSLVQ
jgi:hypothetical protein